MSITGGKIVLINLYFMFFKIGLFTIGGGYAMIPLIQDNLVAGGYMTNQEVLDMIAIAQMTPGPFSVNAATFSGMKSAGVFGAIISTLGMITPSLIITLIVAKYFFNMQETTLVKGTLYGIKPVVAALITSTALMLGLGAFFPNGYNLSSVMDFICSIDFIAIILTIISFVAIVKYKISPIITIVCAAIIGMLVYC